ncbi:S8 family serine peptidase [Deinococcus sp. Marseille-Q6407]|uniref:S8 family serine peptidase n=1 Tax=Deinococcus sp. Marseille-Q6407 TaxID=2969223 RepID=UPI0021C1FC8A|nr:S8 family serine peptidase [Deinococcus sp. Marseille-Q6407]
MTPAAGEVTLDLGYAESGQIDKAFSGNWQIEKVPVWLKPSSFAGSAGTPLSLRVQADRNVGIQPTAAEPQLSDVIKVRWQAPGSATWVTSRWPVQARRYSLSGQIRWPAVTGADALVQAGTVQPAAAGPARQVIVKYRSAAVAQAVGARLGQGAGQAGSAEQAGAQSLTPDTAGSARQLSAQSLQRWQRAGAAQPVARLGAQTLLARPADPQALLTALQQDPAVEYAVLSAPLSTQQVDGPAIQPAGMQPAGTQAEGTQPAGTQTNALAQPVIPTDQYASLQWAYRTLGYGAVWRDMEAGGYTRPVTVAVLDTGVRYDHPDLQGQPLTPAEGALDVLDFTPAAEGQAGYDNGDGDGPDRDPTDPAAPRRTDHSHGTHVSGIIAARWGEQAVANSKWSTSGVVGAAYRAPVKILPVRVIDAAGNTDVAQVAAGLRYAVGQPVTLGGQTFQNPAPAQVINLSLGGPISAAEARPLCDAVAEARAAGAVVVAAAGNYYSSSQVYPAACPGAVAVGSVTLSGASAPRHSEFSDHYAEVRLSAPGGTAEGTTYNGGRLNDKPAPDQIFSTDWDYAKNEPRYAYQAGTSQAAPQVSALAALLLSKGVTHGPEDTEARMFDTATDLGPAGRDEYFGYGMINPAAALEAPAVSRAAGFSLQSDRGQSYQPALDEQGRFTAYLGTGTYVLRAGHDFNGNGVAGEYGEGGVNTSATLSAEQPEVQLSPLQVR